MERVGHVGVGGLNVACCHTGIAQVEVVAIQALVTNAYDLAAARIAPDALMNVVLRRRSGSGGGFGCVSAWDRLRHLYISAKQSTAGG